MAMNANTRPAAARAFVRSLNILLKFARMYDFGHPRTAKQYDTAWSELRTALGADSDNEAGLLLAVSGDQLLLDGVPLESAAAEKSFARMLSAAGIASIHFSPKVTQASLARFVRGFPTGTGAKPIQLAEQLKAALQGDPHIHVNEVCFVPADSAVAKSTVAAQLAARTLGLNPEQSDELFNDPERLLQLIVAAEGTRGSVGGSGHGGQGSGSGESGPGGGFGPGDGSGLGGPGGGHGSVGGSGPGGDGSGGNAPGYYVDGGNRSGGSGVSGGSGAGSSTWNVIGGSGSGAPLDDSTGGFWLNKDGAHGSSSGMGSGSGSGAGGSTGSGPRAGAPIGASGGGQPHVALVERAERIFDQRLNRDAVGLALLVPLGDLLERRRLIARGSGRDTGKLADFAAFTARMRLDDAPAVPHTVIDNRLTSPAPLDDQLAALVAAGTA